MWRWVTVFMVAFLTFSIVAPVFILNIGDSLDKHSNEEFCRAIGQNVVYWSDSKLLYMGAVPGGSSCTLKDKHVSFDVIRVYGSNATRPYFHGDIIEKDQNIVDTVPRLEYALRKYLSSHDVPDLLFFHTVMWDYHFVVHEEDSYANNQSNPYFEAHLRRAQQNYVNRLDEIQNLLPQKAKTELALRTSPYIMHRLSPHSCVDNNLTLLVAYNDVNRALALAQNRVLYDYDRDVWATVNGDRQRCDVLRDLLHVNSFYAVTRTHKMLGWQHSNYLHIPPTVSSGLREMYAEAWLKKNEAQKFVYLVTSAPFNSSLYLDVQQQGYAHGRDVYLEELVATEQLWFVSYLPPATTTSTTTSTTTPSRPCVGSRPRRHEGVTSHFLSLFRLGRGDLYHSSAEELAAAPLASPITDELASSVNVSEADGTSRLTPLLLLIRVASDNNNTSLNQQCQDMPSVYPMPLSHLSRKFHRSAVLADVESLSLSRLRHQDSILNDTTANTTTTTTTVQHQTQFAYYLLHNFERQRILWRPATVMDAAKASAHHKQQPGQQQHQTDPVVAYFDEALFARLWTQHVKKMVAASRRGGQQLGAIWGAARTATVSDECFLQYVSPGNDLLLHV